MWFIKRQIDLVNFDILTQMTDIHSHLMWGVDDGAKDTEQTRQMITSMKQMGIYSAFATPHIMSDLTNNNTQCLIDKFERGLLPVAQGMGFEVRLAGEYMLDESFLKKLQRGNMLTYDGKHILVEISTIAAPKNIEYIIYEICSSGYIPIMAHPERYLFRDISSYERLVDMGCKFQLNILSLSNYYGKNIKMKAKKLLDAQMYDFIGTDIHSAQMIKMIDRIKIAKCLLEPLRKLKGSNELLASNLK